MGRKLLMVLLGVGAVAGFASGFMHMCHGYGHFGPGARFGRHDDFERHVADTCADAALRVYNQKSPAVQKP
jgi:hypothetical protein